MVSRCESFDTDLFSWDVPSFDTDLWSWAVPSFAIDPWLLVVPRFNRTRSFALEDRYRSDAPNDKEKYSNIFLALEDWLRSDAPNDKGEKRYKFKREYYQTAKFVQMLSECDGSADLLAKLMESGKSNHCAKRKKSRKSNHCAKRKKSGKSNHRAKRKKSGKSNHRAKRKKPGKSNHCAKLMKSKNLFDDGGQVKREKFKREYYQMPKLVQMLSEEFNDKDHVQIHCQQADPDGEPLNSTSPNRTGNAPAKFTAINSSEPSQTVNSAEELSGTESGTSPFLAVSQTPADDGDVKKETPSENDNNNGVNKTPADDDDAKKETPSKNDNNKGVSKPPPDDDDAKKETPIKVNKTPPNDDHKGKYKLENALILGGQIISTAAAVSAKNAKSEVSNEAELFLYVVAACLFVSLISIFCGFCLSVLQFGKAARFVRKVGMVVTGFALVAATGLQFPNELMVWFIVGVLAVSAPAIIGFAWKY